MHVCGINNWILFGTRILQTVRSKPSEEIHSKIQFTFYFHSAIHPPITQGGCCREKVPNSLSANQRKCLAAKLCRDRRGELRAAATHYTCLYFVAELLLPTWRGVAAVRHFDCQQRFVWSVSVGIVGSGICVCVHCT